MPDTLRHRGWERLTPFEQETRLLSRPHSGSLFATASKHRSKFAPKRENGFKMGAFTKKAKQKRLVEPGAIGMWPTFKADPK